MIEWEDQYSTGVPLLDVHHKTLFELSNVLEMDIQNGEASGQITDTINSLVEYAKRHFGCEEQCMHERRCPVAAKNKNAHEGFLKMCDDALSEYKRGLNTDAIPGRLHRQVEDWITSHILRIDTTLRSCESKP